MSRTLNDITLQNADNNQQTMATPVKVVPYRRVLALEVVGPITLALGGGTDLAMTAANWRTVLGAICNAWTMKFGKAPQEVVDDALTFLEFEWMGMSLALRDQMVNGKNLKDYVAGDVTIVHGTSATVQIGFLRFFAFERAGLKLDEWMPYPSQLRNMEFTLKRGVTATGITDLTFAAQPITLLVNVDEIDSPVPDGWAPVPRVGKNNQGGLKQDAPTDIGALLALAEITTPGLSTSMQLFSITRDQDAPLQDAQQALDVVRASYVRRPIGAADPNDIATQLYELPDAADITRVPTNTGFQLSMPTQVINPMQSRWLYVPKVDEAYVDGIAGPNINAVNGHSMKLITAPVQRGEQVPNNIAAVSSIAAVEPSSDSADLHDGYLTTPTGVALNLSPVQTEQAKGTKGAVAKRIIANRIKSVPGASSPNRADSKPLTRASATIAASSGHTLK